MRFGSFKLAVLIVAATAGSVRADLTIPRAARSGGAAESLLIPTADRPAICRSSAALPVQLDVVFGGNAAVIGGETWERETAGSAEALSGDAVVQLPPAPGSLKLFLSGVLSVGAWHLLRSARQLHWGALPEWYHTGGPVQIGHAVPLSLDFEILPACVFELPAEVRPEVTFRAFHESRPRQVSQTCVAAAAPRAPPFPF